MSFPRTRAEYAKDNRANRCDVCDAVGITGVYQVPILFPMSIGYCERCDIEQVVPYYMLVWVTRDLGWEFPDSAQEAYEKGVRDRSLEFFGATLEELERDAAA